MPHELNCNISESVWRGLQSEVQRTNTHVDDIVGRALASFLGIDHHSLFQISTSGALVKGIFQGCIRVSDIKLHGDFGLGTFPELDGEMIMLDGNCYQALAGGKVNEAEDDWLLPFGVATHFNADKTHSLEKVDSFADLEQQIDVFRPSENIFVGLRLEGTFDVLKMRTACKAKPGEDLVTATSHQSVFNLSDIQGTLVGFWTPNYARTLNVAGYHLHFISSDRKFGGHLLDIKAKDLKLALHLETEFHMAIPETKDFLKADLRGDPIADLNVAEKSRD